MLINLLTHVYNHDKGSHYFLIMKLKRKIFLKKIFRADFWFSRTSRTGQTSPTCPKLAFHDGESHEAMLASCNVEWFYCAVVVMVCCHHGLSQSK